ncbi:MAG: glycosyltransferase [bacterium]
MDKAEDEMRFRKPERKLKVAILGTRGVPAAYGGFETLAEELGARLADRGHAVTVYGRRQWIQYRGRYYRGMRIVLLPTIRGKYLDTVFHTFISTIHAAFLRFDAALMCNAANSVFTILLRFAGTKTALNVDGIERLRKKWNALGKLWYLLGENLAVRFPHRIVSDADVIRRYYEERYGARSTFIAYGADGGRASTTGALAKAGVEPRRYVLYVARLEPENNAHVVIRAFEKVETGMKLVIVGHAPYGARYIRGLKETADPRIIFTGGLYGLPYRELQSNAYLYVQASEVGGCHPALIEAMGFGNCVIVNDTPENRETVGDAGVAYRFNDADDLAAKIRNLIGDPQEASRLGRLAADRAGKHFSWADVADRYEALFYDMVEGGRSGGKRARLTGDSQPDGG